MSRFLFPLLILSLFVGSGCITREVIKHVTVDGKDIDLGAALNSRVREPYDSSVFLTVHYATNRKTGGEDGCRDANFTVERAEGVTYGACKVNVPSKHSIGSLDEPEADSRPDRDAFFLAVSNTPLDGPAFLEAVKQHPHKEVLVFVHGFNVKFKEAVHRAAQIAYDAKFQGPIVLFTWPAGSGEGFLDSVRLNKTYAENQKNAQATIETMAQFLSAVADTGKTTHIMVHSMGHQVVLPAISRLVRGGKEKFLGELILNAPDFAVKDFKDIAGDLQKAARRVTLYCSPGDNALLVSESVNENERVGRCKRVDGVDVINVNEVDAPTMGIGGLGHGYYSSRPLITDIFQVLLGIDVNKRLFIRKSGQYSGEDYVLRK